MTVRKQIALNAEGLLAFLKTAHPTKTSAGVAAASGVPEPTVRKWFERRSGPSAEAFVALIGAYGAPFLIAALNDCPDWLQNIRRDERRADLVARAEAAIAELRLLDEEDAKRGRP